MELCVGKTSMTSMTSMTSSLAADSDLVTAEVGQQCEQLNVMLNI